MYSIIYYSNFLTLCVSKCNLMSVECRFAHSAFSVMVKLPLKYGSGLLKKSDEN